jgi:hypothetical protein
MVVTKPRRRSSPRLDALHIVRRNNLRAKMKELKELGLYESKDAFSRAIEQSPSLLHKITREKEPCNIGERLARDIEARLRLPDRWLDRDWTAGGALV